MTWPEFSEIFATLALQLRATDADEAVARSYFKAMESAEVELVSLAADRLSKQNAGTNHWFPKTSEWLELTRTIEGERRALLERAIFNRKRFGLPPLCGVCGDTGFADAGGKVARCQCRDMRRLETIGRRPLPELPPGPAEDVSDPTADRNTVTAMITSLREKTGARLEAKAMPAAGVYLQTDPEAGR